MQFFIYKNNENADLLKTVLSCNTVRPLFMQGLAANRVCADKQSTCLVLPQEWFPQPVNFSGPAVFYRNDEKPKLDLLKSAHHDSWTVISNGLFATEVDYSWLDSILNSIDVHIIAVGIDPALKGYREKLRITPTGNLAGVRRQYSDTVMPASLPDDWPCHLFIRSDCLKKAFPDGTLSPDFPRFLANSRQNSLKIASLHIGGRFLNLATESELLSFLGRTLDSKTTPHQIRTTPDGARLTGPVLLGKNVNIAPGSVIAGPVILCDNVQIGEKAVVRNSVIGPDVSIEAGSFIHNRIMINGRRQCQPPGAVHSENCPANPDHSDLFHNAGKEHAFRRWPWLSYAGLFKRIFDIIVSAVVLLFFLPVFPFVALMVKLGSAGPVFYKARRQGLGGREFNCLKFRSMATTADAIQEKLRVANEVDGPQFKIEHDPRVHPVGRFLRNTYIDEIPQFMNVLLGQMSVIGPRPSPEQENSTCPYWRDARLSVRPGITGLWQICRTRQASMDFQEWLFYDTEYVKRISFGMDLWICFKTAAKLINSFLDQF